MFSKWRLPLAQGGSPEELRPVRLKENDQAVALRDWPQRAIIFAVALIIGQSHSCLCNFGNVYECRSDAYLGTILPGPANTSIQRVPELTPTAWIHSRTQAEQSLNSLPARGQPCVWPYGYDVLPAGGMLIFDVVELGGPSLAGRFWSSGTDWAVLAETEEDQGSRTLVRNIETFRRVDQVYRRDAKFTDYGSSTPLRYVISLAKSKRSLS